MLICLCNRISEATVRAAIDEGAATVGELSRACGAGADCGACWDDLRGLLCEGAAGRAPGASGLALGRPTSTGEPRSRAEGP